MRMLRNYILRSVAGPFLFSLGACTGLLLVNQLAKKFGDLVGKDLSWGIILEVLGLSIPFIIALTLPMAVLVAILYGYSQLGQDNEITAMRASGVSVAQMLMPALVAGLFFAVGNFFFVDQVLPRTNARLGNLQNDISRKKPAFAMREQAINSLQPYAIRAGRVSPGTGEMLDIEIFDQSLTDGRRVVYADSGMMVFDERGVDLILKLFHGKVHEYKTAEPQKLQVTRFAENTIRVRNVQNLFERDTVNFRRGDREMTVCEMMDQVSINRRRAERSAATRRSLVAQDLRNLMRTSQTGVNVNIGDTVAFNHCGKWRTVEKAIGRFLLPEALTAQEPAAPPPAAAPVREQQAVVVPPPAPVQEQQAVVVPPPAAAPIAPDQTPAVLSNLAETLSLLQDEQTATTQANKFLVEIHKKYTISLACFSFVLIGVALALRFPRGGMGLVIGGGLAIFAVFYVGLVGGEALADRNFMSPITAMWAPNIIILAAGIIGLLRVRREFGSTRGGDAADLLDTLLRPFRWRRRAAT
ncbi:MAG: LptF/LptG family permease [Gemmatimonadales bacterium]